MAKKNTREMTIEEGLASKVYLLAYPEPKSGYQISKEIYGYDHQSVRDVITNLDDYFMTVEREEWRTARWFSNTDPLLDKITDIKKSEGITITSLERYIIKHILNFATFREWVKTTIPTNIKERAINAREYILSNLEILLIVAHKVRMQHNIRLNVNNERDMESYILDFKNAIMKLYGKKSEKMFNLRLSLYVQFLSIILTEELVNKIKGFSRFGKKYFTLELLFCEIEKMSKNIVTRETCPACEKGEEETIIGTIKSKNGRDVEILVM